MFVEKIKVQKGKEIGRGEFGIVFRAEKIDGSIVALKQQMSISDHEKKILLAIKGKIFQHIIQVFAFEEKVDGILTIMELAQSLDLKNMPNKRDVCLQMAKGVSELHQLGFFHRDLKPDNFVISKDKKIKLIDFGVSKTIMEGNKTNGIGSYLFMAPEVNQYKAYDYSVDIWSLGMVFYFVFTNEYFYKNYDNEYQIRKLSMEISQEQINEQIEKQNLELWQEELLKKMIVQKLFNQGKSFNNKIKRIETANVVTELEQVLEWNEDLYRILASLSEIEVQTFIIIIEKLRKEKILNILEFLLKKENQKHFVSSEQNNLNKIITVLKYIKQHGFNKNDYSTEIYIKNREKLINQIKKEEKIVKILKLLINITCIDCQYIQSGSNALNLLVQMKVDLTNQCFEDIRIKNTSLIDGNFLNCNFSGSEFENVNINGMNLDGALLLNCKWRNIKIDLGKFYGHTSTVRYSSSGIENGFSIYMSGRWYPLSFCELAPTLKFIYVLGLVVKFNYFTIIVFFFPKKVLHQQNNYYHQISIIITLMTENNRLTNQITPQYRF